MYISLPFLFLACGLDPIQSGKPDDSTLTGVSESGDTSGTDTDGPSNTRPVADAGDDREVELDYAVNLDGSGSADPDGDPLTYTWIVADRPSGSTSPLTNDDTVSPSFAPDQPGEYQFELTVFDGMLASDPDTVTWTASSANGTPIADAGTDRSVTVTDTVRLDGSASYDPEDDALNYAWSFVTLPGGSTASLAGVNSVGPSFVADVEGTYKIQLVVDDGVATSPPDSVTITASANGSSSCSCPFARSPWGLGGIALVLPYWFGRRKRESKAS